MQEIVEDIRNLKPGSIHHVVYMYNARSFDGVEYRKIADIAVRFNIDYFHIKDVIAKKGERLDSDTDNLVKVCKDGHIVLKAYLINNPKARAQTIGYKRETDGVILSEEEFTALKYEWEKKLSNPHIIINLNPEGILSIR